MGKRVQRKKFSPKERQESSNLNVIDCSNIRPLPLREMTQNKVTIKELEIILEAGLYQLSLFVFILKSFLKALLCNGTCRGTHTTKIILQSLLFFSYGHWNYWRQWRGWRLKANACIELEKPATKTVVSESDAWTAAGYLDGHTVISHGDTGIAVPTDMYGSVGPVVALPVQGATRRMNVLFGLLL